MKNSGIVCLFFLVSISESRKEHISPYLYNLLNDPDVMAKLEKRFGFPENDLPRVSDVHSQCRFLSGRLNGDCDFIARNETIIKTEESLAKGAKFLQDVSNVSCPSECTELCCKHEDCDTAVYQDKGEHNCYLFQCGDSSVCVFADHHDYWMSSISKEAHNSHSYTPGGATHSHENELNNLHSEDDDSLNVRFPAPLKPKESVSTTTTEQTTITTQTDLPPKATVASSRPGLGEYCESYETECTDPHAECLLQTCRCRVGYHQKHGICRKHCKHEEFECENIVYGSDSRQCVPERYVCDEQQDCIDGSDELDCVDQSKQGKADDMSYKDAEEPSKSKGSPNVNGPADKPSVQNTPSVTVPVAEPTPAPTQKQDPEANKAGTTSTETPKTVSSATGLSTSKQVEKDSKNSITESKNSITESKNSNTVSKNSNTESKNTDTGSMKIESSNKNPDQNSKNSGSAGKNSNSSSANVSDENGVSYHILNSGMVKVESFTDGSLGPVVALSLGLAITLMLLIFVGCRLRTVKRRLRKGRALHSNEADYLINGMYL
ncbi:low-density lipoprotein receptor-related protein 11-like [Dreissena polymorpha]|nr:low-density lipoprotein receptor-related protein 11-like [Dreissena polymorpha]